MAVLDSEDGRLDETLLRQKLGLVFIKALATIGVAIQGTEESEGNATVLLVLVGEVRGPKCWKLNIH
jgi:hypothetical protein